MDANITKEQLVGDLLTERPSRSRVFEKYGIDFCCGGRQTLQQACQNGGLDPEEVIAALAESDAQNGGKEEKDWSEAGITELLDHVLETHHAFMKEHMPHLTALVNKVADVHGENHPELREVHEVYHGLRAEIEAHLMKEEQVLFPFARQLDGAGEMLDFHCGSLQNPIRVMIYEHENAGGALARLRELTNDYTLPEDGCNTYLAMLDGLAAVENDLHWHIHKENNILFPAIVAAEQNLNA